MSALRDRRADAPPRPSKLRRRGTGSPSAVLRPARERIHIIGGPGSGKTTLATQLAQRTGLTPHHLDDVARIGGGNGPLRSVEDRDRLVEQILATDAWITEGVHLHWTEAFLERADVIVWLDYVSWPRATRRIVRRFASGALHEMRSRPMRERFTRFRDYGRHLRTLGGAIVEARQYYGGAPSTDRERAEETADTDAATGTWAAMSASLALYSAKLIHCRSSADVADFVATFR